MRLLGGGLARGSVSRWGRLRGWRREREEEEPGAHKRRTTPTSCLPGEGAPPPHHGRGLLRIGGPSAAVRPTWTAGTHPAVFPWPFPERGKKHLLNIVPYLSLFLFYLKTYLFFNASVSWREKSIGFVS